MIKNWNQRFIQLLLGSYVAALIISVLNNNQNWGALLLPIVCGHSLIALILSLAPSRIYKNSLLAGFIICIFPFIVSITNSFLAIAMTIFALGLGTKIKSRIETCLLLLLAITEKLVISKILRQTCRIAE